MSGFESPQDRRDRLSAVVVTALICLALPSVILLVSEQSRDSASPRESLFWLIGSMAGGILLPFLYWAPYRALGLVPVAALAWLIAVIVGLVTGHWSGWAQGLPLGVMLGSLARGQRGPQPPAELACVLLAVLAGVGLAYLLVLHGRPWDEAGYLVLGVATVLMIWAATRLFRPLFEMSLEPVVWLAYDARGTGPGLVGFPRTGPYLVIANHACWFDPLFLAKVVPRPITPMMTQRFYDLPVIRRLMVAFGVIRVPEKAIKKDAVEIQQAIAALDRGECLVVFPEGYLRRGEDRPLRRFGQGIWQILQARPETPVYACWIEGAWGSYTSYCDGPPTKNKKRDFRHAIRVGVSTAETVPQAVLAENLPTRIHLMNLVSQARVHLDLPPLPLFDLPVKGEELSEGSVQPIGE